LCRNQSSGRSIRIQRTEALKVKFGEASAVRSSEQPLQVNSQLRPPLRKAAARSGRISRKRFSKIQSRKQAGRNPEILAVSNVHKVEDAPTIPRSNPGPAPLSFAQEQIWLHGQFAKAYTTNR